MANASRDENSVPTLIGVSNEDGSTIIAVQADPTTHALKTNCGTDGDDLGPSVANHDENDVPTLLAVSSDDGKTPVAVYVDSDGRLLVDKT